MLMNSLSWFGIGDFRKIKTAKLNLTNVKQQHFTIDLITAKNN